MELLLSHLSVSDVKNTISDIDKKRKQREQKLVDICFQLVLTATDPNTPKAFVSCTSEKKAKWVADIN